MQQYRHKEAACLSNDRLVETERGLVPPIGRVSHTEESIAPPCNRWLLVAVRQEGLGIRSLCD